jgi:hypothetical protein
MMMASFFERGLVEIRALPSDLFLSLVLFLSLSTERMIQTFRFPCILYLVDRHSFKFKFSDVRSLRLLI